MSTEIEFLPQQREWIDALKSGKYKQGKAKLHTVDDEFCCLGVACFLFKERLNLATYFHKDPKFGSDCFTYQAEGEKEFASILPTRVTEYLHLLSDSGHDVEENPDRSLIILNDGGVDFNGKRIQQLSLEEIGELLETHPERYFSNFAARHPQNDHNSSAIEASTTKVE